MQVKFAKRIDNMKGSEIREAIKLTLKPGMISFAGGLPAPEMFPVAEMKDAANHVLEEAGAVAMQYATTEGYDPLREKIAARMKEKYDIHTVPEQILITNGSQQGLDFSGKLFLDEGDVVLFESPSYMGAFNAFKAYQPRFMEVPTDEEGMIPDALEKILQTTERVKMIYVIPDFQNPTGRTWSLERRKAFMEIINRYNIPVIEDNPYGELRYEGEAVPSLKSMDEKGLVIFLGSFSKILAPGYRIGWICAAPEILQKYIFIKQGADLQPSTVSQMEISRFMELYDLDAHVERIRKLYGSRRNLMLDTMKETFPAQVKYTNPKGGLFTWVELPENMDAREVLMKCVEKNVAYIPGGAFYPEGGKENTFRLNFSNMPEDKIVEGIRRIGEVLQSVMQ